MDTVQGSDSLVAPRSNNIIDSLQELCSCDKFWSEVIDYNNGFFRHFTTLNLE